MQRLLLTATIAASIAFGAAGAKANEPDPTDDGNIIVECVGAGGPAILGMPERATLSHVASVPRHPLGPSACWPPKEHGRLF
jgi:hypothetical protein